MMAVSRIMAQHSTDARLTVANDRLNTAPQRVAHYLLAHCTADGKPAAGDGAYI